MLNTNDIDYITNQIKQVWQNVFSENVEVDVEVNSGDITIDHYFEIAPQDIPKKTISGTKMRREYIVTAYYPTEGHGEIPPDVNEYEVGSRSSLHGAIQLLVEFVAGDRAKQALESHAYGG